MEAEPLFTLKVRATRYGQAWHLPDFARDFGHGLSRRTFTRTDARKTLETIQAAQLRDGKKAFQERRRFANPPDLVIQQAGGIEFRIFPAPVHTAESNKVYHSY
jgi:hypothetical protein